MHTHSKGKHRKPTTGPLIRADWDSIKLPDGREVPAVGYTDSTGRLVCKLAVSLESVPSSIVLHDTDTKSDELYQTIPLLAKCKEQPTTADGTLVETLYCLDGVVKKSEPCPHTDDPHYGEERQEECRDMMPEFQTLFGPLTMAMTTPL